MAKVASQSQRQSKNQGPDLAVNMGTAPVCGGKAQRFRMGVGAANDLMPELADEGLFQSIYSHLLIQFEIEPENPIFYTDAALYRIQNPSQYLC